MFPPRVYAVFFSYPLIHIQAFKMNNMDEAQKLWEQVIAGHARELEYWLEYSNLARLDCLTA